MVTKIPVTGKSVSRNGSITVLRGTEEWLFAVSVHGMGLALMAKKASGWREACVSTGLDLAPVGLQVRIDTFAAIVVLVQNMQHRGVKIKSVLVVALELFGLVVARGVHRFPWAVI
jgi:hypothetical protein